MKKFWYWYTATSSEIFVDLDSKRALQRALSVLRRAVQKSRYLPIISDSRYPFQNSLHVQSIWVYPSQTANHFHLIIVLKNQLPVQTRIAWALWMGGDQLRAAYVMERWRHGNIRPELICTTTRYGFRIPDNVCHCQKKHKQKQVTDACPALRDILDEHRSADYFPRNQDRERRGPLRVEWGKLSKRRLLTWQ